MTTNQTIKRVGKLVAGLALTGSTMLAVGGGCEGNVAQLGNATSPIESTGPAFEESDFDLQLKPHVVNGRWVVCCPAR